MNLQPGLILPRIKGILFETIGLIFLLYITGLRYAYQGAADLGLLVAVSLAAGWLILSHVQSNPIELPQHSWGYLPLILSGILATIYSISIPTSIVELKIWAVNLFLVIVIYNIKDKRGLLFCLLAAGSAYTLLKFPAAARSLGQSRLTNPNNTAAFLNVLTAGGMAVILNTQRKSPANYLGLISWGLASLLLLFTGSRAAIIAGLFGDLVACSWKGRGTRWPKIIGLTRACQLAAVLLLRSPANQIKPVTSRLVIWNRALEIFKQYPITGSGLNTFRIMNQTRAALDPVMYIHPHNLYLGILCQLGIVGLIGIGIALICTTSEILLCQDSLIKMAAMGALAALLIHGLVDVPYFEPYNMRAVLIPMALALPSYQNDD